MKRSISTRATRKYYFPALGIKFFGAIVLGLIYQFYYDGGDTFNYWTYGSSHIWKAFKESPIQGLRMIFSSTITPELWEYYSYLWFRNSDSASYLIKVVGFFDILTFHTYSATALFFAAFSFSGSWALFSLLAKKYTLSIKYLFASIFLVPSVVLWGSGIMKDTLTIAALFWIIWSLLRWFEFKSRGPLELVVAVMSFYIIYKIKIYVLISLIPCMILFVVLLNLSKIKSTVLKILAAPLFLVFFGLFGFLAVQKLGQANARYQLDNIAHWSRVTSNDLRYWTGKDSGSGYSLGQHDGTWQGMLTMAPSGVLTALFRPFIWESSNPLMLLNALESFLMLLVAINAIIKKKWRYIRSDTFLIFCLIFTLIFAFAVGVSTFNFGSLSRYRIPLVPFFLITLTIKFRRNNSPKTI